MQFGRLDGFVTHKRDGWRWVTVLLDTGRDVETLRDASVPAEYADREAALLAEQMVQEALENELALDGWEVIGEGSTADETHSMLDVVARSRTWVLRRCI